LIPIPLPSSTLLLTIEEAQSLLDALEAALPHSNHYEVAGEELTREEMVVLMDDLRAILLERRPRAKSDWRKGF